MSCCLFVCKYVCIVMISNLFSSQFACLCPCALFDVLFCVIHLSCWEGVRGELVARRAWYNHALDSVVASHREGTIRRRYIPRTCDERFVQAVPRGLKTGM
jgi:hypothetical protein